MKKLKVHYENSDKLNPTPNILIIKLEPYSIYYLVKADKVKNRIQRSDGKVGALYPNGKRVASHYIIFFLSINYLLNSIENCNPKK